MWVRMPKGSDQFSVQQQHFKSEHKDAEGFHFARIPPHLAPLVMGMHRDFAAQEPEDCDIPDLSPDVQGKDQAIGDMAAQLQADRDEIQGLRADMNGAMAALNAAKNEVAALTQKNAELEDQVAKLKEDLEDAEDEVAGLKQQLKTQDEDDAKGA